MRLLEAAPRSREEKCCACGCVGRAYKQASESDAQWGVEEVNVVWGLVSVCLRVWTAALMKSEIPPSHLCPPPPALNPVRPISLSFAHINRHACAACVNTGLLVWKEVGHVSFLFSPSCDAMALPGHVDNTAGSQGASKHTQIHTHTCIHACMQTKAR